MLSLSRPLIVCTLALSMFGFALAGCSSGGSSAVSGEDLVKSKCTTCHSLDTVTNSTNSTKAEWETTVKAMEAKGLSITDAERTAIVDYLAK